jgi:hypothetical protein
MMQSPAPVFRTDGDDVLQPYPLHRGLRTFRVVPSDHWPAGALAWTSARQRGVLRRLWRIAVMRRFSESSRVLRLAWALQELAADKGYAFSTDAHLASETRVPAGKVERALKELQDAGCIIRVHVSKSGRFQRRIFLAAAIIGPTLDGRQSEPGTPATVAGQDTLHGGPFGTLHGGGTEDTRKTRAYRYPRNYTVRSTVAEAAEADAARRAARARGDRPSPWFSDGE